MEHTTSNLQRAGYSIKEYKDTLHFYATRSSRYSGILIVLIGLLTVIQVPKYLRSITMLFNEDLAYHTFYILFTVLLGASLGGVMFYKGIQRFFNAYFFHLEANKDNIYLTFFNRVKKDARHLQHIKHTEVEQKENGIQLIAIDQNNTPSLLYKDTYFHPVKLKAFMDMSDRINAILSPNHPVEYLDKEPPQPLRIEHV